MVAPLSLKEFSCLAGVSVRTVTRWIRVGKVPVIRLGDRVLRIPRDAAEKILADGFSRDGEKGQGDAT